MPPPAIAPVNWTSRLLKRSGVLREDDGQNDDDTGKVGGGPNGVLPALTTESCERKALAHAMAPSADMSLIPEATRDD